MQSCLICQSSAVRSLLDFGRQALSNRFLATAGAGEELFPFALGQCIDCGLIQFLDPISPGELRARFDWISYNEAEGHLDKLVAKVCGLPGVSTSATVGAVSFKDDSTIARFQNLGYSNTWRLELGPDLGVESPCAALETLQDCLSPETAHVVAERRGTADVLIVRHVLEHAHRPRRFTEALRALVKPSGYLVIEVPDCAPALTRCDYTMPWEEHILYFTPTLFTQSLARLGFQVLDQDCYPYTNENSLVAIVKPGYQTGAAGDERAVAAQIVELARRYASAFQTYRKQVVERLTATRAGLGATAIFGAGHLSCAWINFLAVAGHIEFVVDDHPRKRGMFMPGSKLAIRPSSDLLEQDVRLCLLSLSAESESKVLQKNQAYLNKGGRFASIFPGKANSFVV